MPIRSRSITLSCLVVLSFLYGVAELVPGRFTQTAEVFFKAAGRNWARTGRFGAPEIVGRLSTGPPLTEVYFAQPPVYTFLYGVYVKAVGFGPRSSIAYDVLIHLLLVWSAVAVARTVFALPWPVAGLSGALMLPLGTVGRPDELGIVFALCAALSFRSQRVTNTATILGGMFLGLCGATSLGALLLLGPLVCWKPWQTASASSTRARWLLLAVVGALTAAAACIAPILISHPAAYRQLMAHAGEQSAALSWITRTARNSDSGFLNQWKGAPAFGPAYIILVVGLWAFAIMCWAFDKARTSSNYSSIVLTALSMLFLVVFMPGKYYYLWFSEAWLLIACAALATEIYRDLSPRRRVALLAFGAIAWIAAAAPYFRWKAILWTLPADQSLNSTVRQLREEIPADRVVVSSDYWWILADRDTVYDITFGNPEIDTVDFVIASGNGSGEPGTPVGLNSRYQDSEFQVLYDHLNTVRPSLLGIPLSHSAYGFGAYVLKKKRQ